MLELFWNNSHIVKWGDSSLYAIFPYISLANKLLWGILFEDSQIPIKILKNFSSLSLVQLIPTAGPGPEDDGKMGAKSTDVMSRISFGSEVERGFIGGAS